MTSETDKWQTPKWFMRVVSGYYDPCPPNHDKDFLKDEVDYWTNKFPLFINPPYSDPLPFILKGIEAHKKYGVVVIFLLKMDSSTKWYKALVEGGAHFLYFAERLHYSESKQSPPFASVLAILSD